MRSGEIRRIYRLAALGAREARVRGDRSRRGSNSSPCSTCTPAASTRRRSPASSSGSNAAASSPGATTGCRRTVSSSRCRRRTARHGTRPAPRAFRAEPTPGTGVSLEQRVVAVALADQVGAVLAAPTAERSTGDAVSRSGGGLVARADVLVEPAVHRLRAPPDVDDAIERGLRRQPLRRAYLRPRATLAAEELDAGVVLRVAAGAVFSESNPARVRSFLRRSSASAFSTPGPNGRRRLRRGSAPAGPATCSSPDRRRALRR